MFIILTFIDSGRDSVVGIVTRLRAGWRRIRGSIPGRNSIFIFFSVSTESEVARKLLSNGYRCSFCGLMRPKREADHLPPFTPDVKHVLDYTSGYVRFLTESESVDKFS
jgi:hypothetical protein